ncbi:MAG: hypothetical protein WCY28_03175, partial [Candidatus Shapirobacteria bacterium]
TEIDKLIEGRWTVQVFAIDPSGLKKDNAIDLFIIKNSEIIFNDVPVKTVLAQKKLLTEIKDTDNQIIPILTSFPTVLGTSTTKKKFNLKWFLLVTIMVLLYISIRKYNNKSKKII